MWLCWCDCRESSNTDSVQWYVRVLMWCDCVGVTVENHRTQTQYNDMLIIKLFAFQFVNSYTSLYYIAFFRGVSSSPYRSTGNGKVLGSRLKKLWWNSKKCLRVFNSFSPSTFLNAIPKLSRFLSTCCDAIMTHYERSNCRANLLLSWIEFSDWFIAWDRLKLNVVITSVSLTAMI